MNSSALDDLLARDKAFADRSAQDGPAIAFREFVHEHATLLTSSFENVEGRDNIFARMNALPSGTTLLWEPQDGGVAESGELGWTWGRYTSQLVSEDGETQESQGKYLNIWVRNDQNEWKVLIDLGN